MDELRSIQLIYALRGLIPLLVAQMEDHKTTPENKLAIAKLLISLADRSRKVDC